MTQDQTTLNENMRPTLAQVTVLVRARANQTIRIQKHHAYTRRLLRHCGKATSMPMRNASAAHRTAARHRDSAARRRGCRRTTPAIASRHRSRSLSHASGGTATCSLTIVMRRPRG